MVGRLAEGLGLPQLVALGTGLSEPLLSVCEMERPSSSGCILRGRVITMGQFGAMRESR